MKTPGMGWRTWVGAGLIAVAAIALTLTLFREPATPPRPKPESRPANQKAPVVKLEIGTGAGDALLKEEAMLRDPAPLFLPTQWNAGENALPPDARREPGGSFEGYAAHLWFVDPALNLKLPPAVSVPQRPADAFLTEKPARPFAGFGQSDTAVTPLVSRAAYVEVLAAADGKVILAQAVRDTLPLGEASWQPLEFLIAIEPSGMVRPPMLTESSRVTAVDDFFEDYIETGLHIGERLAPGFYRVSIGP